MHIEPISFYELARTSHIKRWTIINTTNQQNLAEHQYNVTVISLALYKAIIGVSPPTTAFVLSAMFHDSAEIRYGDVPTPAKVFMKKFVGDDELFNGMDSLIMPQIPYAGGVVIKRQECEIIKLADMIEAAWWIKENGVGTHAKVVAEKCRLAVDDHVHDRGWHKYVNPILMDLGMVPINPHLRITPP